MPKEKRIMPLPLQIKTIRRILRKANPDLEDIDFETTNGVPDPENESEYYDWTTCLEEVSLPENIRILEDLFPHIHWQLPREREKVRKGPRRSLRIYESTTSDGTSLCADVLVIVQPHKTFDKKASVLEALGHPFEYEFGRVQITVPKELVGTEAKVHIEFPNAPKIQKRRRRGRRVFDYYQL